MARESPAQKIKRITRIASAWASFAAGTRFYGMTLAQFKRAVKPSYDSRARIARLERQIADEIQRRTAADEQSMRFVQGVVCGVRGHPDHTQDGALYGAMGYVRTSARRRKPRRKRGR